MGDSLDERFEAFYRSSRDPWDYWKSTYEIDKYKQQISLVSEFCSPTEILEIACSVGAHTRLIHEAFPEAHLVGVDISATAVDRARENLQGLGNIDLEVGDIFSTSEQLRENSLDAIFWSEGFDFLHDHCKIADFSKLARRLSLALRPGGVLCVSHIVPTLLSHGPMEAGGKNVEVFHVLLGDYFRQISLNTLSARKVETDALYRYEIRLYRPRLLKAAEASATGPFVGEVDVIIPARNEADTIGDVVKACSKSPRVGRIIVVDNGSVDGTKEVALAAGALVLPCAERGYGRALRQGMEAAQSRWVFKLDADIENADPSWVESLIAEAERHGAGLVKGCWNPSLEDPDRVTNFTVKPALRIFFPELLSQKSPLSGVYLLDRQCFDFSQLPNGYSFDVALLINALSAGVVTAQAELPSVQHATIANGKRTYQHYFDMSEEILRYIVEAGLARLQ